MPNESQIESIKTARLLPGDIVILRCRAALRAEVYDRLQAKLKSVLPDQVKVLVLDAEMEIELLRPDLHAGAIVETVESDLKNGGGISKAMRQQYGLQRKGM